MHRFLCPFCIYLFIYLGRLHLQHREVPGLGVQSEPQLPAYTTAMAMMDLSHICDLYCSLRQCQILNPLREARDRTHILMHTSRVLNLLSHSGNSFFLKFFFLFSFWLHHGTWTSLGQGSNSRHSSDLSRCSDNTRSLTHCTTKEFLSSLFL